MNMNNACPMCDVGKLVPEGNGMECDNCGQYFELDDEGELIIPSLREILDERKTV